MIDDTEQARRDLVAQNAAAVESDDIQAERARLEAIHGVDNVWDTQQLQSLFEVQSFAAPFCMVKRRGDGKKGAVEFQHWPRLYFRFEPL